MQQNYQLKKQIGLVCELGPMLLISVSLGLILKFAFGSEKLPGLLRNQPLMDLFHLSHEFKSFAIL